MRANSLAPQAQILLAGGGEDLPADLHELVAAESGLSVPAPSSPEAVFERIADDPELVALTVIGPGVRNPLVWVQRLHALDSNLSVMLLAASGAAAGLRAALRVSPYIGEDVTCIEVTDERLAQSVVEAADRRRKRQAYAHVTAALNRSIGKAAAPPTLATDFGRLLDHAPIGVLTVDPQGAICGTNRQTEALFRAPERELVGQSLSTLFAPDDRESLDDFVVRAAQEAATEAVVFDRSHADGEAQYLELSAVASEIGPHQPGALALLQDITERELTRQERDRKEEALRQQRRWYEATVLGIGDAVIATDEHGRVSLMNSVAEELTGWSQADASGADSTRVFHIVKEATGEIVESPVTRVLREGVTVGLANHTILIARDGRRRPIDDSGAPIRDSEGHLVGVVLVFRDVSERRRTEQALRESEQRFRAVFEQAAAGIALVAPEGVIAEVNGRFGELVGYSREELLAMDDPVGALTHPDDLALDRSCSASLVAGDIPSFQLEKRYVHKDDGHDVWVRLSASALRDEAGNVQQLIGIAEDIGERKHAEEALRASEEHLRLVLDSLTHHAIFTFDLDGRVNGWNPGAERLLGYAEGEILGQPGDVIFSAEDRRAGEPRRELEQALVDGQAFDDRWHVRKDGSLFWASGMVSPLGASERPRGFVKILRDQTQAKQAEEQLKARARQQAAVSSLGQRALAGVSVEQLLDEVVDVVAQTLGVNLCKILRLLPEQGELRLEAGVGWPDGCVGRAHVGSDTDSQAGYTLRSDQPIVVEDLSTETRFSGPPLLHELGVVSGMSVIIAGDPGRPWGVLGAHDREYRPFSDDDVNFLQAIANILAEAIGRSRTEQRLRDLNQTLEQRVAERTAELEQRAAQLRALTAELTQTEQRERRRLAQTLHDHLQQMLVAAKFQIGTASRGVESGGAAAALERVGDLLDKSIQESRSLTMELSPPVLYDAGLVAGLEWLARWMEENHGLSLELSLAEEADPAGEDLRMLLFQTARELSFNVVKHAAVERAELALRRAEDGRIEIEVHDRGRGFVPEAAEPLKEKDEQGFGLFSVRERFARLGGELHIESTPEEGTRVTAVIAETAAADVESSEKSATPGRDMPLPLEVGSQPNESRPRSQPVGEIRVVVADDHTILREGVVGVLNGQADIEVIGEAADGEEAVDRVRQEVPDVVVLDITMPRMNGLEAARIIAREFPGVRVIGLSVHESDDMAEAMRNAGASVYLNKAGPSSHLLAAIRGQRT